MKKCASKKSRSNNLSNFAHFMYVFMGVFLSLECRCQGWPSWRFEVNWTRSIYFRIVQKALKGDIPNLGMRVGHSIWCKKKESYCDPEKLASERYMTSQTYILQIFFYKFAKCCTERLTDWLTDCWGWKMMKRWILLWALRSTSLVAILKI